MVVGTILLAAGVLAALLTVRLHFVPVWEHEDEAARAEVLERQWLALQADLGHLVENRTSGPLHSPQGAGREEASLFSPGLAAVTQELALEVATLPVNLSVHRLLEEVENLSAEAAGLNETWVDASGTDQVGDVHRLLSLRLRLGEVGGLRDGDAVTINATDEAGARVGNLTVYQVAAAGGEHELRVRVCRSACSGTGVLFDQAIWPRISGAVADVHVDALDRAYRFDRLLAAADTPLVLNVSEAPAGAFGDVDYAVAFTAASSGITNGGASAPATRLTEGYAANWTAGGSLTLRSRPNHLPAQDLVLEHGAFVLRQGDASLLKADPFFAVSVSGNLTTVRIGLPSITGANASATAPGIRAVQAAAGDRALVQGQATRFTLNVTTAFPGLWTTFWTQRLQDAGLAAGHHFAVAQPAAQVAALTVYGFHADPGSEVYDLRLTLRQADVQLTL